MVSEAVAVLEPVAVAAAEAVDDVLARLGSRAPHGWFSRQSLEHELSEPQAVTHWLPHSSHTKYGRVREYSEMLGCRPLPQTQP